MNASSFCLPEDARKQEQQKWIPIDDVRSTPYVEALGVYWTYCGLGRRPAGVFDQTTTPPGRCQHCRSRIRYPLFVPDALKALRNGA